MRIKPLRQHPRPADAERRGDCLSLHGLRMNGLPGRKPNGSLRELFGGADFQEGKMRGLSKIGGTENPCGIGLAARSYARCSERRRQSPKAERSRPGVREVIHAAAGDFAELRRSETLFSQGLGRGVAERERPRIRMKGNESFRVDCVVCAQSRRRNRRLTLRRRLSKIGFRRPVAISRSLQRSDTA